MAQKKITELQLITTVTDSINFAVDNGTQTYRATMAQIKNHVLAAGNVVRSMIEANERQVIGSIQAYMGTTAPAGWLMCDGSTVSRTTYASLYAVIGDKCGQGDGSTTFELPDLRGRFLRGWDNSAGNDPDAASRIAMDGNTGAATGDNVGSYQADAFQGHYHNVNGSSPNEYTYIRSGSVAPYNAPSGPGNLDRTANPISSPKTDGSNGTPRTTSETRPANLAVAYIIKY